MTKNKWVEYWDILNDLHKEYMQAESYEGAQIIDICIDLWDGMTKGTGLTKAPAYKDAITRNMRNAESHTAKEAYILAIDYLQLVLSE